MDSPDHGTARGRVAPLRLEASARFGVLQTYLRLYLDPGGELLSEPSGVRDLAQFLASAVVAGTGETAARHGVACRTLNGSCSGAVETRLEAQARRVVWQCPVCGLSGSIAGWEGTRWDRRPVKRAAAVRAKTTARDTRVRREVGLA